MDRIKKIVEKWKTLIFFVFISYPVYPTAKGDHVYLVNFFKLTVLSAKTPIEFLSFKNFICLSSYK